MDNIFFMWLAIAFVFVLLEVGHPGLFFFLSFSLGAIGAAIASLVIESFMAQASIFFGLTLVAMALLRYWVAKHEKGNVHYTSNVYALEGKKAIVVKRIQYGEPGAVKVGGETWGARLETKDALEVGTHVIIVRVQGSHLIVAKE